MDELAVRRLEKQVAELQRQVEKLELRDRQQTEALLAIAAGSADLLSVASPLPDDEPKKTEYYANMAARQFRDALILTKEMASDGIRNRES